MSAQNFYLWPDATREKIRANLHMFIDRLPADKPWQVSIERHVKRRTDKQRKALFAAAYGPIMEFMGLRGEEDKSELHRFFCAEYFGRSENPMTAGKPIRTTTRNEKGERDEISVDTALDMYAFIQQRAAEQGIYVPDPDPLWRKQETAR